MNEIDCERCEATFEAGDSFSGYRAPDGRPMLLCTGCGRYTPAPTDTDSGVDTDSASTGEPASNAQSRRLTLTEEEDGWVATDEIEGVQSRGRTRTEAIESLDRALAVYNGKINPSSANEE